MGVRCELIEVQRKRDPRRDFHIGSGRKHLHPIARIGADRLLHHGGEPGHRTRPRQVVIALQHGEASQQFGAIHLHRPELGLTDHRLHRGEQVAGPVA